MNLRACFNVRRRKSAGGFTMAEILIAGTAFALALMSIITLLMYGLKSFGIMGNYVDLDMKSRNAVDIISQELRNASGLTDYYNSSTLKWLKLTNGTALTTNMLTYDGVARTLVFQKTGEPAQTLLTECDQFEFSLYSRAPRLSSTNITFYGATNGAGATDPAYCKLINMSWKCSRKIMGSAMTTESVQTAQIVLRNKVK